MDLKNKIAIVTAASRGIGLEITHEFVKQGATVYMAVRKSDKNIQLVSELAQKNSSYKHVFYDALDFSTYQDMIDNVIKDAGQLDILVNNFGTTNTQKDLNLVDGDTDTFFEVINTNIASVYYTCKYAIPHMIKNNGGSIVNISSIGGITPDIARFAYSTSKAAVNSMTKNIATQYAQYNIRCNAILPGFVATDATKDNLPKEFMDIFIKNVPLSRVAVASDIANATTFLASDKSSYITGELLPVAGGFGMPTPIYSDFIKR